MNSCVWPAANVPTECRFHTLLNKFCLSLINNYSSLVASSATVEGNGDGFGRSRDTNHENHVGFVDPIRSVNNVRRFLSLCTREPSVPKARHLRRAEFRSVTDAAHCAEFSAARHLTPGFAPNRREETRFACISESCRRLLERVRRPVQFPLSWLWHTQIPR